MSWRDRKGFLGRLHNIVDAITKPESYIPPPLATPPPPSRPSARQFTPPTISYISRGDLPTEWGRNESALWQDATRSIPELARDDIAQMYYDAALYTFSDSAQDRADAIDEFKRYVWDEYGIDWDEYFDWEGYRESYDSVAS